MKTDDAITRQWLDLDLEGELGGPEKARLEDRLRESPELRNERRLLGSLHAMLEEGRISVRPGFRDRVSAALPRAAWERRLVKARLPAWVLPVAMVAVFAAGAALLLGLGAAAEQPALEIGLAIADFLGTTALAGAGMLFATWRGFGFVLEELVADSGLSLLALGAFVLFLDLLFFALLRRRPAAARAEKRSGERQETP